MSKPPPTQGQYLRKILDQVQPTEAELDALDDELPQIVAGASPISLMASDQLRVASTAVQTISKHLKGVNESLLHQYAEADEQIVLRAGGQAGMRRVLLVHLGHIFDRLSDEDVQEILRPVLAIAERDPQAKLEEGEKGGGKKGKKPAGPPS